MKTKFNFGKNWLDYSNNTLNEEKFIKAQESLVKLIGEDCIAGKSFLDIGCGSGIFSLAAGKMGASEVAGFDISRESVKAADSNLKKFGVKNNIKFFEQSILSDDYKKFGKFDVVYSWGVLHHTGNMRQAIANSMELVNENGIFAIAIYNKHWSSPVWKIIKYAYNISPARLRKIMVFAFYLIIFVMKFLITFKNPLKKDRGMSFYYDVIDWIGGYPYEYASAEEIKEIFENNNFKLIKIIKAAVPTGCNQFVFSKHKAQ